MDAPASRVRRVFEPELVTDPVGWLERRLADLPGLLEQAGHPELMHGPDVRRVREALPSTAGVVRESLQVLPEANPDLRAVARR